MDLSKFNSNKKKLSKVVAKLCPIFFSIKNNRKLYIYIYVCMYVTLYYLLNPNCFQNIKVIKYQ